MTPPVTTCLPCAALALVEAIQDAFVGRGGRLKTFPIERIKTVLDLIEPHFVVPNGPHGLQ